MEHVEQIQHSIEEMSRQADFRQGEMARQIQAQDAKLSQILERLGERQEWSLLDERDSWAWDLVWLKEGGE